MEIRIDIPQYNTVSGFQYKWENGFKIETESNSRYIKIRANREGLISLAHHLLNLAQESVPIGYHLHLDEYNSLEDGSIELMIEKI